MGGFGEPWVGNGRWQGLGTLSVSDPAPTIPTTDLYFRWVYDQEVYSDAGVTPVTDTGSTQEWHDLIQGRVNSQTTALNKPVYNAGVGQTGDGTNSVISSAVDFDAKANMGSSGMGYVIFRPHDLTGTETIFGIGASDSTFIGLYWQPSVLRFHSRYLSDWNNQAVLNTTIPVINTWYSVVIVSTGGAYRAFINNIEQGLTFVSGSDTGNWFADFTSANNCKTEIFGLGQTTTPNVPLDGDVREVGWYNSYNADTLTALLAYLEEVRPA